MRLRELKKNGANSSIRGEFEYYDFVNRQEQCYGIMREVAKHSTWQTSSKHWLSSITLHTNQRRQNVEWTKSSRVKLLPDKVGVRRERIRTQGMRFCCFRGRLMRGIYMPPSIREYVVVEELVRYLRTYATS